MNINIMIAVLVGMILCHLLADYPLQGWLAQSKAKSYWANSPESNRRDWIAALACHAAMWGILIMIPMAIASKMELGWFWMALPINIVLHMFVDHMKANRQIINLIQDQTIHFVQILGTWGVWSNICCNNISASCVAFGVCFGIMLIMDIIYIIVQEVQENKKDQHK